jgi:CRISPR-associated protein Cas6
MLDLSFELRSPETAAAAVPRAYRRALAAALERVLPWLADEPEAAVHRLNLPPGSGPVAWISARTRLTLRLPRTRVVQALTLRGSRIEIGDARLIVGEAQPRELLPLATQYAHLVAADEAAAGDEARFLRRTEQELEAMGVSCRAICGRAHSLEAGALHGFGLMLDGLSRDGALRVLQRGLGAHRRWGCGVFVPHRSAAAVGTPT